MEASRAAPFRAAAPRLSRAAKQLRGAAGGGVPGAGLCRAAAGLLPAAGPDDQHTAALIVFPEAPDRRMVTPSGGFDSGLWYTRAMRYGFYLPTRGPTTATREGVLALAR